MTQQELINSALRLLGVLAAGEPTNPSWTAVGSQALADMMDTFASERNTIYIVERAIFPLVSNQQQYTIGPGGDFDHARPVWIDRASVISNNNPAQPLELGIDPIMDTQQWQALAVKAVYSALPTQVYYDYAFPLGNLFYWPIPNVGNLQAVLYLPTAITGFTDYTTNYTFPPGYAEMLRYNLAVRLGPEFGRTVDAAVSSRAITSLANVKRSNVRLVDMITDPALSRANSGFWNWRNDSFGTNNLR